MSFVPGKDDAAKKEQTSRDQRETRREEREPREERQSKRQERPATEFSRTRVLNGRNTTGRPAQFAKQYNELVKDVQTSSTLLVPTGQVDGMRLVGDRGFLILATNIGNNVYWHPIIIEMNQTPVKADPIKSRRESRDSDIELFNYSATADGVDRNFVKHLEAYVRNEIVTDGAYVFTEVTVIPTEIDLENEDNIRSIAYLAEDANATVAGADGVYDANSIGKKTQIRGAAQFNQDNIKTNMLGRPYRADFTIELSELDKENSKEVLFRADTDRQLVSVDGFVTGAYYGPDELPEDVPDSRRYNPAAYIPEINITNVNTYYDAEHGQFDRAVLGLSTVPFINSDGYWTRNFESQYGDDEGSRKLSGFLYGMIWENDEIPSGLEEIDEDEEIRSRWFKRIFKDNTADVCYLVQEGGVDYTIGKLLINIGLGSDGARLRLIESINNVSDFTFEDICDDENRNFRCDEIVRAVVRVPYGYFKVKGGAEVPSEMIDTLYLLNKIKQNSPDLINDWFDTTSMTTNMDESEAFTRLLRLYSEITGKQFVHKGFVSKVYLGGTFMKTMYRAVKEGPLAVRMEHDNSASNRTRRRQQRDTARDGLDADLVRPNRNRRDDRRRDNRRYSETSYR